MFVHKFKQPLAKQAFILDLKILDPTAAKVG
jgi:hypothetical protein